MTVRGKGADPRQKKVRVRGGKGRTASSRQWLERQLNDPYVARAKREGARSRAAYKLIEIDDKARFLRKGMRVSTSAPRRGVGVRLPPNGLARRSMAR